MKLLKGKENIAEIYDIEDHTLYMKLYNLDSLRDLIDNDEVYVQLDKYDIAYQIQNGLKQIHKKKYYNGYVTTDGQNKAGTEVRELLDMESNYDDFREDDINKRNKMIIDTFIDFVRDNNLIK